VTAPVEVVDPTLAERPLRASSGRLSGLARRLDERLIAPGSSQRLALVRSGLAIVVALRVGTRNWALLAHQPPALFEPIGVAHVFPHMPGAWFFWAVRAIGVVAAVLVVARKAPTVAFPVAWLCLLVLAGLWSSAGKILHNDVLLLLTCVPMLFAPADQGYGDRSESPRWGWPPRAGLAMVGLVYFLTGYQKLHHSGPAWVTGDNMRWVLYQGALDKSPFPSLARDLAGQPWLTHVMAGTAIGIELAAPLLLFLRPTRRVFLLLVAGMHTMIWVTLGLDYWGWILTVAAVTLPAATVVLRTSPPDVT